MYFKSAAYLKSIRSHKKKRGFRFRLSSREKDGYLILRRKGLSYNTIAECFGRSTSVVYRVIQRAVDFKHKLDVWGRKADIRKLPRKTVLRNAIRRRVLMLNLRDAWEEWVDSEEGEPP